MSWMEHEIMWTPIGAPQEDAPMAAGERRKSMSRCKSCGAEIIWIKMASGKVMPADAKPITYKTDLHKGDLTLITPDGKVAKGFFDPDSDKIGYTSHFATCPNAGKHRRRER